MFKFWIIGKLGIFAAYGFLIGIAMMIRYNNIVWGSVGIVLGVFCCIMIVFIARMKEKPEENKKLEEVRK